MSPLLIPDGDFLSADRDCGRGPLALIKTDPFILIKTDPHDAQLLLNESPRRTEHVEGGITSEIESDQVGVLCSCCSSGTLSEGPLIRIVIQ